MESPGTIRGNIQKGISPLEEKNPIQVADRMFSVIEMLAETGPVSLGSLSRALELNKSTVHRILNSLICMNYVKKDKENCKYALSFKIWEIANKLKGAEKMNDLLQKIQMIGIVPVVVLNNAKDAAPLAKALCDGGLPCAEVTFRTDAAEESIRIMTHEYPQMLIGAGTVLTTEQVDRAVAAGAKFIVSPGFNPKVVKYCVDKGILIMPGVTSPSQVEQAIEFGLDVVKFFPAEESGGINMIKSMSAPYANMKYMPTGGINAKNINDYLAFDKIVACGGSWMVKEDLVKAGDFAKVTEFTREAVLTMLGFELRHVGINCENEEESDKTASKFETMFGFCKKIGNNSIFAGTAIEAMKAPFLGDKGHIAVGTNSVLRAVSYLERQGFELDMETAKYAGDKMVAVYFKEEISGFAVHLLQK